MSIFLMLMFLELCRLTTCFWAENSSLLLFGPATIDDDFTKAYGNTEGIISGKQKRARLFVVTTSSSLGRSSVYNRLKLDGTEYFKSIGYTGGWGHFHIPDELFWTRSRSSEYLPLGTMITTEIRAIFFQAVTDNSHATYRAERCER